MVATNLITLLTDFGLQDVYVGIMKGVITKINPQVIIIDLSHKIPPQNVAAGRFALLNAYKYFPQPTIHLGVVDPGVGSQRRGIAIQFAGGYLVGPDNGLFSGILQESPPLAVIELTNQDYWLTSNPSNTFHGRDIFAPVAAYLSTGIPLEELGTSIDPNSLKQLSLDDLDIRDNNITGYVQYIDHFGNLITNIPAVAVQGKTWSVKIDNISIPQRDTYNEVEEGELVALIGSHGWLEIAVNGGNGQKRLQLNWGEQIQVTW